MKHAFLGGAGGLLVAMLAVEMAAFAGTDSDAIRAAAVSAMLGLLVLLASARAVQVPTVRFAGSGRLYLALWMAIAGIGAYGCALGLFHHNQAYYILADLYHWFVELLLTAALGVWILYPMRPSELARGVGIAGLLLGCLGLLIDGLGFAGLTAGGGRTVVGSGIWRLEIGRGFPELLLIVVTAAMFVRPVRRGPSGRLLLAAFVVLLLDLVLTLKRTMWLSYLGGVVLLRLSRRGLMILAFLSVIGGVVAVLVYKLFPLAVVGFLKDVAQALTYTQNYTVQDTLQTRVLQYAPLFPDILREPWGRGFGAQYYTWVPELGHFGLTHYVHNFYLYYALQLGVPGLLLLVTAYAALAFSVWRHIGSASPWDWAARAAFTCVVVLGVNGLTLVSTHTVFAAMALALAATVGINVGGAEDAGSASKPAARRRAPVAEGAR